MYASTAQLVNDVRVEHSPCEGAPTGDSNLIGLAPASV
jgi:hypothetical protein